MFTKNTLSLFFSFEVLIFSFGFLICLWSEVGISCTFCLFVCVLPIDNCSHMHCILDPFPLTCNDTSYTDGVFCCCCCFSCLGFLFYFIGLFPRFLDTYHIFFKLISLFSYLHIFLAVKWLWLFLAPPFSWRLSLTCQIL